MWWAQLSELGFSSCLACTRQVSEEMESAAAKFEDGL